LLATRPNRRVARLEKYTTANKIGRVLQVLYRDDNLQKINGPVCIHNDTWWVVRVAKTTERDIFIEPLPHVHEYNLPEPENPENKPATPEGPKDEPTVLEPEESAILDLGAIRDVLPTPTDETTFPLFDIEYHADEESVHMDPGTDKEDDPTDQQICNSPISGGTNLLPYNIRTGQLANPLTTPPRYLGYTTLTLQKPAMTTATETGVACKSSKTALVYVLPVHLP
jgi:hypothetical protein